MKKISKWLTWIMLIIIAILGISVIVKLTFYPPEKSISILYIAIAYSIVIAGILIPLSIIMGGVRQKSILNARAALIEELKDKGGTGYLEIIKQVLK